MVSSIGQLISPNSLGNQVDISGLPTRITQAIKNASARTGVDFSYLLKKAEQESGFDTNAKASGSSATGLYQFTSQTWLRMIKNYGAQYGLASSADSIKVDSTGVAHVTDTATRKAILELRNDPQISAEMAGELDKQNAASLQDNVGGKIGGTELYLAHFLGAGGASDFLNSMRDNPSAKAADVLPDAASANPSVFYNSSGQPRSLAQVYQHFAQKFDPSSSATYAVAAVQSPSTTAANTTVASYSSTLAQAALKSYAVAQVDGIALVSNTSLPSTYSGASSIASTYVSNALNQVKTSGNSLVATMLMAQMSLGEIGAATNDHLAALTSQQKKNTLTALSATA